MKRTPPPPPPPPRAPVNGSRPKPPPPPKLVHPAIATKPPKPPTLPKAKQWPLPGVSDESAMLELGYSPRAIAKANERTRHEIVAGKISPIGVSILNNGNMYKVDKR